MYNVLVSLVLFISMIHDGAMTGGKYTLSSLDPETSSTVACIDKRQSRHVLGVDPISQDGSNKRFPPFSVIIQYTYLLARIVIWVNPEDKTEARLSTLR